MNPDKFEGENIEIKKPALPETNFESGKLQDVNREMRTEENSQEAKELESLLQKAKSDVEVPESLEQLIKRAEAINQIPDGAKH